MQAPATAEDLRSVHQALARFWRVVDGAVPAPPAVDWRLRFMTAVAEIAANIVRHAFPPEAPPGALRLQLRFFPDRVVARFTDRGRPFADGTPAAARPAALLRGVPETGYGLTVARAAVDQVEYRRTAGQANIWRLVKLLP